MWGTVGWGQSINQGEKPGIDPSLMALGEGNSTLLQYSSLRNPMGGGCSPWDRWESDMTERLHFHFLFSCIWEGNGNPLQCSCLENPRGRRAWWAALYGHRVGHDWSDLAAAAVSLILSYDTLYSFGKPSLTPLSYKVLHKVPNQISSQQNYEKPKGKYLK